MEETGNQTCPVCKAGCSKDKIIPIYGRGADASKDPRRNIPKRPAGERPEAPHQRQQQQQQVHSFVII